ncbi:glycoside hydrolase family 6 protein [Lactococcus insecticola]|uniref:DUF5648 domain-containing protein n=1 Tax=Pseudolactococcus insecticola TaxID=2709158 RepID=A0A6A0B7P6_9LACT|nr:glycoside hydrolase family 6 protein [Lactococcus insecticola]GFH39807.1 hypothetical protein Hs20B_02050 [Lactococcus insecticola]
MKKAILGVVVATTLFGGAISAHAADSGSQGMYRLYNPNSGEHFYTANINEKNSLAKVGWRYEGIGWTAPQKSSAPVYRLYNKNAGDHHYTVSSAEKNMLVKAGWRYEGIGWYSSDTKAVPLYRAYNPNAKAGSHNYTANLAEQNMLVKAGWRNEGIGWYGIKTFTFPTVTNPKKQAIKLKSNNPANGNKPGGTYIYSDIKNKTISGNAYSTNSDNPLAVPVWAVNNGFWDNPYQRPGNSLSNTTQAGGVIDEYENNTALTAAQKVQLNKFVSQPRSIFFTPQNSGVDKNGTLASATQYTDNLERYIAQLTASDKNALVQISLFGIYSVAGGENTTRALTAAEKTKYVDWISGVTKVIARSGAKNVAIIMEPDAAMLAGTTYKDAATRKTLVKNAVATLSTGIKNAGLKNAIYIDAGSADWLDDWTGTRKGANNAVAFLKSVGIQNARGFALGATHFDGTADNISYAKDISNLLSSAGIKNKKAVIDTADNGYASGRGYTNYEWTNLQLGAIPAIGNGTGGASYDDQKLKNGNYLSALGVPPTYQVGNAIKGTTATANAYRAAAQTYVDGYLYFGRPQYDNNASPYDSLKALTTATHSSDTIALP